MQKKQRGRPVHYLKWIFGIIGVQLLLINISAAIYAYKFTHFYAHAPDWNIERTKNIFRKTGKLIKGPSFQKDTTEPLPSFPYGKVIFRTGSKLRIEAWQSTAPSGKGAVALFHGLMANKSDCLPEAEVFLNSGYSVLLVDFRGHGHSEGFGTTIGYNEAEEVKLAYSFLAQQGEKRIFLFGKSMGAVAVARAAAVYSLRPAGIILDMPFDGLLDHIKSRGRSFGFPKGPFGYPVTFWIGVENNFPAFAHRTSLYAQRIACPVLLQWGTRDHLVTQPENERIYDHLPAPHKKGVPYQNAAHFSLLAQEPVLWKNEINVFLNAY